MDEWMDVYVRRRRRRRRDGAKEEGEREEGRMDGGREGKKDVEEMGERYYILHLQ